MEVSARFPVDLTLLHGVNHMPALPELERSMHQPGRRLQDFCIPVNHYFPTPELLASLGERLGDVLRYYPSDQRTIAQLLGERLQIDPDCIVAANGSTELITWINQLFVTGDVATDVPTFGRWTDNPRELGHCVHGFVRQSDEAFHLDVDAFVRFARTRRARAIVTCNPNNPTSALTPRPDVMRMLDRSQDFDVTVIDESFIDFTDEFDVPSVARQAALRERVIVIKSLGKCLGLHGLRCGYAVCHPDLARRLRSALPPWNVNSLAVEFLRLVANSQDEFESARRRVVRDSRQFAEMLTEVEGLTVHPCHANFVYCELDPEIDGVRLRDRLLTESGCFVRECGSKLGGSSQCLRIATRPRGECRLLVAAMRQRIADRRPTAVCA